MTVSDRNADQWNLYSDMPNADQVAASMNTAFNQMINDIDNAVQEFVEVPSKFWKYGATDTEPREIWQVAVLEHVRQLIERY